MGSSVRPDDLDALISARQAAMSPPASASPQHDDVDSLIASRQTALGLQQKGVFGRAADHVSSAVSQFAHHPFDTIGSLVTAPVESFANAVAPTTEGAARLNANPQFNAQMAARFGREVPVRGVTPKEKVEGMVQTAANAALPGIGGAIERKIVGTGASRAVARIGSLLGVGSGEGAAYTPDDPVAGALAGGFLAPATEAVGRAGVSGATKAAGLAIDMKGRPMSTRPMSLAGIPLGDVEGISDRAARINAQVLGASPSNDGLPATSKKPVTPMDIAGTAGVRAVRGLKTTSPAAEAVIRTALEGRADNAVDRVIQHGLETTGLVNRESGILTEHDLHNQAAELGHEAYTRTFAGAPNPITDPAMLHEINAILGTDAGKAVLRKGMRIANNFRDPVGSIAEAPAAFDPATLSPDKQVLYQRLLKLNGGQVDATNAAMRALGESTEGAPAGPPLLAPTLKQMHYIKLGFDDLLNGAPEPGTGGSGPVEAASVRQLKKDWLKVMDAHSADYRTTRGQYADIKQLERGAQLGQQLFKMDPDQMQLEMSDLPATAQQLVRRTGFNALADRVENGPSNVEQSLSKPRDQRRMRILFPDDESFNQFKQGLTEEAQMHANTQGALGGSNTADKLADVANMAGVTLPDVVRAMATGRWHSLAGRAAASVTKSFMSSGADAVAAERARQLVAGVVPSRIAGPQPGGMSFMDAARSVQPSPLPMNRRLAAPQYATGDVQGTAMPIPQPVPRSHWLASGPTFTGVAGDAVQSAAMPIPQPLPLNRRLLSGGPAAVPTAGQYQMGPGIPARGLLLDLAVQKELDRLYKSRPELAVSMTREQQAQLAAQVRARLMNPK